MLRVLHDAGGSTYVRSSISIGISEPQGIHNFSVLLGPYSSLGVPRPLEEVWSIPGSIQQGEQDWFGDRDCYHTQITGDVIIPPFALFPGTGAFLNVKDLRNYYDPGGKMRQVSDIVPEGSAVDYVIDYKAQRIRVRCSFQGLNAVVGYHVFHKAGGRGSFSITNYSFENGSLSRARTAVIAGTSEEEFAAIQPKRLTTGAFGTCWVMSFGKTTLDYQSVMPSMMTVKRAILKNFLPATFPDPPYIWGDLCQTCIDQTRATDVNSISFIRDLREISKLIPKFKGWANPKTYANAYLAWTYGAKLTIQDTKALATAVRTALSDIKSAPGWRVLCAGKRGSERLNGLSFIWEYHYKVVCDPYENRVMDFIRHADSWGLYPTSERCWDYIPFSFVVDWFTKLGDLFSALDARALSQYFYIGGVCRSRKVVTNLPAQRVLGNNIVVGTICLTHYTREVHHKLDLPPLRPGTVSSFSNFAEATALIVALRK